MREQTVQLSDVAVPTGAVTSIFGGLFGVVNDWLVFGIGVATLVWAILRAVDLWYAIQLKRQEIEDAED